MPDEPEEGFTVRDRRRVSAEDTTTAPPAMTPPTAAAGSMAASESADDLSRAADRMDPDAALFEEQDSEMAGDDPYAAGQIPDVYSVLALFLGELRNIAWLRMGLVANPATGEMERDLPQAKTAIDTVAFLATQLEPVVAPEERLPLKALVSDLQVNFVEQSKRA